MLSSRVVILERKRACRLRFGFMVSRTSLTYLVRRCVLMFSSGGSYQTGTSSLPSYNLSYIVERSVEIGKPILAASINYRKGGWGMMYSREIQVRFSL